MLILVQLLMMVIYKIRDLSWCVPSIDPSNDNRMIVQKGLSKKE